MKQEYGTLEPVAQPQKSSRRSIVAAVVAACLVASAVIALGFSTGFMQVESSVDTNRMRSEVTTMHSNVAKQFQEVCDEKETRFVIAQFNDARDKIVATVKASADPFDWNNDFKKFKNMLPQFQKRKWAWRKDGESKARNVWRKTNVRPAVEGDPGVAYAVYDLSIYIDALKEKFLTVPVFVTYMDPKADQTSRFLGGSFMGGAALAAKCTKTTVTITRDISSYKDFCQTVIKRVIQQEKERGIKDGQFTRYFGKAGQAEKVCGLPSKVSCPFKDSTTCSTCSSVDNWGEQAIWKVKNGAKCCAAIRKLCEVDNPPKGCNPFEVAMYMRNCDKGFGGINTPVALLDGLSEDKMVCNKICRLGCHQVADRLGGDAATMANCAACNTNLTPATYGKGANKWTGIAKCNQDADGFVEQACCGMSKECSLPGASKFGRSSCGKYPLKDQMKSFPCKWDLKSACPKIVEKQKKMAAETGCCTTGKESKDMKHVECCDGKGRKFVACPKKATSTFKKGKCPKKEEKKEAKKEEKKKTK